MISALTLLTFHRIYPNGPKDNQMWFVVFAMIIAMVQDIALIALIDVHLWNIVF